MFFEVIGAITDIEKIAIGVGIRDRERLRKKLWSGALEKTQGIRKGAA
jgi:hypothetical protein